MMGCHTIMPGTKLITSCQDGTAEAKTATASAIGLAITPRSAYSAFYPRSRGVITLVSLCLGKTRVFLHHAWGDKHLLIVADGGLCHAL